MKSKAGRPMKYAFLLLELEDDQIYTPATIVNRGLSEGTLTLESSEDHKQQRVKIRHSLARLSKNHGFPEQGDGTVQLAGQAPIRGWSGKRWKAALSEHQLARLRRPPQ
ncbi:hypothetical protein [Acanthopleuribacter pedis]|uniref:Uncharacterized protein n=1 Tax=Acanthopleuribacter pedis TaxID=442870 RepID=A0A8J7QDU4_9BACT|nr:hypothetical protein [Acanthopleuribacter pedis]MBO1319196.1 hypothetical protein [Acanthopleuribacter pedis]